jgi:FMN reductase
MADRPFIVGLGGTMRRGSTTERALRHALECAERAGAATQCFDGGAMPLAPYDPHLGSAEPSAAALVEALRRCDGVIVASPSYHGSISGFVKNALDHIEALREDARPYLDGRAVGCIVVAEGPQSMGSTLIALRSVVHALRGWPTPYAATIDAKSRPFADATPEAAAAEALELVARQVVGFAQRMR